MTSWNHHYSNSCPPLGAAREDVDPVYRFVGSANITEKDFEPHRLKYPNDPRYQKDCKALATSVFDDSQAALYKQKKFPASLGQMKLAKGYINKLDGKVDRGSDSHISWWIEMTDPQKRFKVMP